MKTLTLLFCLLAISGQAISRNGPKLGERPPLLKASALLQAPPGSKLDAEALSGKVVVLEFWATWCGPCVMAIPHLNELAEQFKDKPVQFVAITAEDEATVTAFLKKKAIKAWVALDSDRAMNKAYGIRGIPHTVVLNKDGAIAAITYPTMLTDQHIEDLLAGKKISLPEPDSGDSVTAGEDNSEDKNQTKPLFELLIRPSSYTNSQAAWGGGKITARGYTVWGILPMAFKQSPVRIMTNAPLPEERYDIVLSQPNGDDEEMSTFLQLALKASFGLTAKKVTNQINVLVLKSINPNAPGLVISATRGGSSRSGPGVLEGINYSMTGFAMAIEHHLNQVVIDETKLTNRYDISLKWEEKSETEPNREGFARALREQLSLELVPARRPVEMLLVEQRKKANDFVEQ